MRILHWALNIALMLAGLVCMFISYKAVHLTDFFGAGMTGITLLGAGIYMSIYTAKNG